MRRGDRWEDGEVTSQRTCLNGAWTWTTVWGLTVGKGWAGWRGAKGEKNWDNCNSIDNKKGKDKKLPTYLTK